MNLTSAEFYSWDELATPGTKSLLTVTGPATVYVTNNVTIDLRGKGRGFHICGGVLTLTGGGTLTLVNGMAEESGGAVLIESGALVLNNTTLILDGARASYAAGLYMLAGEVRVECAVLRCVRCTATDLAGGGMSVWDGLVQVRQGTIEVVECTTPWHAAGFVVFLGKVELDDANIVATRCSSGTKGQSTSYGGGVVIGEMFPGHLFGKRASISFRGTSRIEVTGCSSSAAVAVLFRRAVLSSDSDRVRVVSTDNVMWPNTVPNLQPSYIVVFRRCKGDSIRIESHDNRSRGRDLLNTGLFSARGLTGF